MTKELTHWRKFHNPDYIGAYAFQPGEEKVLTISKVDQSEVKNKDGKPDTVMTVHFKEKDVKPLICNVTNARSIETALGSGYIEDWIGEPIQLYVTAVSAFGTTTDAVRVRPKKPKLSKPKLTDTHPQWGNVVTKLAKSETNLETVRKHFELSEADAKKIMSEAMNEAPLTESMEVS
jgi:hypothetical protein